jgi:uncharacterized protein YndB with AHSA1/START domain
MGRTGRARRVLAAPPEAVYATLVDRGALEVWLPPDGMRGRIERWDPRAGGGFGMVLTHLDPTDTPGKSSEATDVVDVAFADLDVPPGIDQTTHETGIASSLANLASYVEK